MVTELIRFELYQYGNVHDGGLVSSHDDTRFQTKDWKTYIEAVREFNNGLDVPPYYMLGEENRAFFTQAGYARFKHVIDKMIASIHKHAEGWEVREIRAIVPQEYVLFEDEYQQIVELHFYEQIMMEEAY